MKILNATIHGILDYVLVVAFALAPTVFGLDPTTSVVSYVLAVVHLLITLSTAFPMGIFKFISVRFHGLIELFVAICLIILPLGAGYTGIARNFYLAAGVIIFVVWMLTKYSEQKTPKKSI